MKSKIDFPQILTFSFIEIGTFIPAPAGTTPQLKLGLSLVFSGLDGANPRSKVEKKYSTIFGRYYRYLQFLQMDDYKA